MFDLTCVCIEALGLAFRKRWMSAFAWRRVGVKVTCMHGLEERDVAPTKRDVTTIAKATLAIHANYVHAPYMHASW